HIKKIAEVNNLELKLNERIDNVYAYLKRRNKKYGNVNLDILKLNKLAEQGFKNNTYNIKEGDVLLFFTDAFPIEGKWQIIELTNNEAKFGKLTKKGNISKRAKKRIFDKDVIDNCVRNYSELNNNKHVIKEINNRK
ncbi:MAG: hypothetical protein ACOC1K_06240, partial [Nanoarchaeota archaeon]